MRSGAPPLLLLLVAMLATTGGCTGRTMPWRVRDLSDAECDVIRSTLDDPRQRATLRRAIEQSVAWFAHDESRNFYPVGGITHERARRSVETLAQIIDDVGPRAAAGTIAGRFALYEFNAASSGDDPVLFTGYYAPEFAGARTPDGVYRFPLYRPPDDARRFAARDEIERSGLLEGLEMVWLRDAFDAYIVHVNGSARIRLRDGSSMNLAHVATNQRPYTSLGGMLIEDGWIEPQEMSLQAIRAFFDDRPELFRGYARRNERFVFFEALDDAHWPRGSTGMALTPLRSIASDKAIYPAGCVAMVSTTLAAPPHRSEADSTAGGGGEAPVAFRRLMVDQDSGGAIRGPERIDLFIGIGSEAGGIAGRQISRGRIAYLLLR